MKLIYELDVPDYETMNERDPMCPALWRYRKKITIEHLSFKFQEYSQGCNQQDKCEVLAEFLEKVLAQIRTIRTQRKILNIGSKLQKVFSVSLGNSRKLL